MPLSDPGSARRVVPSCTFAPPVLHEMIGIHGDPLIIDSDDTLKSEMFIVGIKRRTRAAWRVPSARPCPPRSGLVAASSRRLQPLRWQRACVASASTRFLPRSARIVGSVPSASNGLRGGARHRLSAGHSQPDDLMTDNRCILRWMHSPVRAIPAK